MFECSNLEQFMKECASLDYEKHVSLSEHSTIKVGGYADYVAYPKSESALCALVDYLNDEGIKYTVVGNGSNLIFADEGYRGVIVITNHLKKIRKTRNTLYAESGVSLTALAVYAQKHGLSGLEFAYGIPGTVGGAVYMNAGAYGGEIKDVLQKSAYFDPSISKRCELYKAGHKFGYRDSVYETNNNVILSAVFELKQKDPAEIKAEMDGYMAARKEKQPLDVPSAGSTFKRPEGHFAGALIEQCGLKGLSIGGAQVSPKHAGFIVNANGATEADISALIEHVQRVVKEQTGVTLEPEVKRI